MMPRSLPRPLASAASPPPDGKKDEEKKPSRWQQIKTTVREHGPVFVGYYAATYATGFGVCFTGVTLAGVDGIALLQYFGIDEMVDISMLSARAINALIAAEINETFDLVRLPFVIATTPRLSRYLRGPPKDEAAAPTTAEEGKTAAEGATKSKGA